MKFFIKYKFLKFSCLLFLLIVVTACSNDDGDSGTIHVELAEASYHEVMFTRISATEVRDDVYIRIGATFKNASSYSNLGIYKMLLDASGQEISRAVAIDNIAPDTYTRLIIDSGETLFEGLGISKHEVEEGHSFKFVTFGDSGSEINLFTDDVYELSPNYNMLEFNVDYTASSSGHVDYVRISETNVTAEVDINLTFTISADANDAEEYTNIGLMKHLFNDNGVEIGTAIAMENIAINTETTLSITDIETLFEGIDYGYNTNLDAAYTFSFTAFALTDMMETVIMNDVFETTATFQVRILPVLQTGTTWIVTNNNTGFSKEVQLFSVQEEFGIPSSEYFFTDFGIDWSWWNDFWYSTSFALDFPEVDGNPYVITLGGTSGDMDAFYDGVADDGVTIENRKLRLMGYTYKDGSVKGHYDETTGDITFTGVNILDWWWGADSHDNISMTFVKKP
ncbi:hypothetical protein [uncultured Polaribacter sp.]|uniref:hypothetical protein n=1 Tax=uncultured Polaribacter sp. TaxID=174711 RepID=UPI00261EA423|nr:hypothetical protein [uncultured Polaribacter sp.]